MPPIHPHLADEPPKGRSLRDRVEASGPLAEAELLRLGLELSRALAHRHAAGALEEGLSPDSVFLAKDGGAVLVTGRPAPDGAEGWVPFERLAERPQPASDLYQLGAVILFAATGKRPAAFGLPQGLSRGLLSEVPAALRPSVERLLDPVWDKRPKTALESAEEFDCLAQGKATPRQRFRRKAAAGGLAALLALGAGAGLLRTKAPPAPSGPPPAIQRTSPAFVPQPDAELPLALWSPVREVSSEVMALRPAADGGIWVFTKSEAALFEAGSLRGPRKTLDDILEVSKSPGPTKEGPRPRRPSYAAGVGAGGEAFMGGWDGAVYRGRLDGTAAQWPPVLGEHGRVDDMAWRDGTLWAAWNGRLWTWREGQSAWAQPPGHPPTGMKTLDVSAAGEVLAGGAGGLWRQEADGWRRVWKGTADKDDVVSLAQDAQGRLLVGTHDGFLTLTRGGEAVGQRELQGHWVTGFAEGGDGRLWVGTWDSGVHLRADGRWFPFGFAYGLPSDTVAGLAVNAHKVLWVGMYGGGAVAGSEKALADAARAAEAPARLPGDAYDSVEDAARRNTAEGKPDGGVARLRIGELDFVYFDGRQVAPPGPGWLSADGTSARFAGNSWVLRRADGAETALPPMPSAQWGGASAVLIDAKGRLWAGTSGAGVFVYDSGSWKAHEAEAGLDKNPVTSLAEDKAGNIWVGTAPPFDREAGKYQRKNLHRFDGRSWTSYSPDDGLGYWYTAAVRALPDGSVAAATNGGLSVVHAGGVRNYSRADGFKDPSADWVAVDAAGRLLLTHYSDGLTLADDYRFSAVKSRQGLFSDKLRAAAFDGRGRAWLLAADGRAFVTTWAALKDAAK
ncbi:MAG: hypothetical protein HY928_08485 [Elusimicrobia bacterium]|nr:hypothetical protein [Elusimicrobiota bacterium]